MNSLARRPSFLLVFGISSRSRLRGTQGGRLYTTVQVRVQAGLYGVVTTRSLSAELEPSKAMDAPLLYTHAATRHSLQAFPVATATDITNACVLRVRVYASVRGTVHVCGGTWKSFLWYVLSVLLLTRECKYRLILMFIPQRSLHFCPVVCRIEAHRQFEHE